MALKSPPIPKEHGTWAMFWIPALSVWILVGSHPAALLFLLAAAFAFLAQADARRLLQRRQGLRQASPWFFVYLAGALVSGAAAVLRYERWGLLLIGLAALGTFLLSARRPGMTALDEILAILGLSLVVPGFYHAATGRYDGWILGLWFLNLLYFWSSVLHVRFLVRWCPRQPRPEGVPRRLVRGFRAWGYGVVALGAGGALAALGLAPAAALPALGLALVKGIWAALHWPTPRSLNLKRIGFTELGFSILFLIGLIWGYGGL